MPLPLHSGPELGISTDDLLKTELLQLFTAIPQTRTGNFIYLHERLNRVWIERMNENSISTSIEQLLVLCPTITHLFFILKKTGYVLNNQQQAIFAVNPNNFTVKRAPNLSIVLSVQCQVLSF